MLRDPTERDLQLKIGASQYGSACTRCVAKGLIPHWYKLQGIPYDPPPGNRWWLPAKIGTAVHAYVEDEVIKHYPDALVEQRVLIGELKDYGEIRSTTDLYIPSKKLVLDWKTTDRKKLAMYKIAAVTEPDDLDTDEMSRARLTLTQYRGQLMSYGWGMVQAGYEVANVSAVFICRDGKEDADIWSWDMAYDQEYAEHIWNRLERIWEAVKNGRDVMDFTAHISCWCQVGA